MWHGSPVFCGVQYFKGTSNLVALHTWCDMAVRYFAAFFIGTSNLDALHTWCDTTVRCFAAFFMGTSNLVAFYTWCDTKARCFVAYFIGTCNLVALNTWVALVTMCIRTRIPTWHVWNYKVGGFNIITLCLLSGSKQGKFKHRQYHFPY